MPLSLKEVISSTRRILMDNDVHLSTPLGHIVPRDFKWVQATDSCKRSGGGWSVNLLFWWHLVYPKEVIDRSCFPNNKGGILVSINVLDMVCIIVHMSVAIFVCDHDDMDL